MEKMYGKDKILSWRRGYLDKPPKGESLKEVHDRIHQYLTSTIIQRVKKGESVLVVAHGNTLRAVIKHLENISDEKISLANLPQARPIVYTYHCKKFTRTEGEYDLNRTLR